MGGMLWGSYARCHRLLGAAALLPGQRQRRCPASASAASMQAHRLVGGCSCGGVLTFPCCCAPFCRRRTDWFDDRNDSLLPNLLQVYPQVRPAWHCCGLGLAVQGCCHAGLVPGGCARLLRGRAGALGLAGESGTVGMQGTVVAVPCLNRPPILQAVSLEMETAMLLDLARCSRGSIRAAAGVIALADRQSNGGRAGASCSGRCARHGLAC